MSGFTSNMVQDYKKHGRGSWKKLSNFMGCSCFVFCPNWWWVCGTVLNSHTFTKKITKICANLELSNWATHHLLDRESSLLIEDPLALQQKKAVSKNTWLVKLSMCGMGMNLLCSCSNSPEGWSSLIVTRLACSEHRLLSSKRWTMKSSAACMKSLGKSDSKNGFWIGTTFSSMTS